MDGTHLRFSHRRDQRSACSRANAWGASRSHHRVRHAHNHHPTSAGEASHGPWRLGVRPSTGTVGRAETQTSKPLTPQAVVLSSRRNHLKKGMFLEPPARNSSDSLADTST